MKQFTLLSVVGAMLGCPWLAAAQAGDGCCPQKVSSCNPCKVERRSCEPCKVKCCEKRKISYSENKVSYKLVKEKSCEPKTKYVCRKDPCNPCNVQRVAVTEMKERTHYRWVRTVKPVWKEKTIRVCSHRTIQPNGGAIGEANASVSHTPAAG